MFRRIFDHWSGSDDVARTTVSPKTQENLFYRFSQDRLLSGSYRISMARPKNLIESLTLTITTTHKVKDCLEKLVETGTYGRNTSEAASRIVDEYVRERFFAGRDSKSE